MPLIENFTATQYVATPNLLVLDDTSTGSDGAITVRYVYLQKADGSYLVEEGTTTNYEVWTLASGNTISFQGITAPAQLQPKIKKNNVAI